MPEQPVGDTDLNTMTPIRVVCAVIERAGKILVARRSPGRALAGKWEFPGGRIESGEDAEEALKRELREEMGIEIRTPSPMAARTTGSITLIPFRCFAEGEPQLVDHDRFSWVTWYEAALLDLADADWPVLQDYAHSTAESGPAFWWVSQGQTHRHEAAQNYMWSPKVRKDGAPNLYYDYMLDLKRGDFVFCSAKGQILYFGRVVVPAVSCARPGDASVWGQWDASEGWRVEVRFEELDRPPTTMKHLDRLHEFLTQKDSPVLPNGAGKQRYLSALSPASAVELLRLVGPQSAVEAALRLQPGTEPVRDGQEYIVLRNQVERSGPDATVRDALVKARVGQGRFRDDVLSMHKACPFTGLADPRFLRAGHLMPWCYANNAQRLDPLNGLALAPGPDLLVDQGFITFDDVGHAQFSHQLPFEVFGALGLDPTEEYVLPLANQQLNYIRFHRKLHSL